MPWFTKKERRRQVSAFLAIFEANFSHFRRVSTVFRPVSAVSATGQYDLIWSIRPNFGRISPVRRKSKPIRYESSRIGANRAKSAPNPRKKKKKKPQTQSDVQAIASDAGAAPLVPHLCFLACNPPPKPTRSNHHRRPTRSAMHRHQNSTAKEGLESWKRR